MKIGSSIPHILAGFLTGLSLQATGQTIPRPEQGAWALGTGYDTNKSEPRAQCLQGRIQYRGFAQSNLQLTTNLSTDGLTTALSGTATGEINAVIFGGSASAHTYTSYEEGSVNSSTGFQYEMRGKTATLNEYELTELGKNALALNDPKAFEEICGNTFIGSADLGGRLVIHSRIDTSKKAFHHRVEIETEVCVLGICSTDTQSMTAQDVKENTLITSTVTQVGGLKSRLPKFELRSCRLDDVGPCKDIVNQILAYVNGPEGFAAQMSHLEYNIEHPELSSILQYGLDDYAMTSLLPAHWNMSEPDNASFAAIAELIQLQAQILKKQARAEIILTNALLSPKHDQTLRLYLNRTKTLARTLAGKIKTCPNNHSCFLEIDLGKKAYEQLVSQDMVLELQDSESFKVKEK